MIADTRTEANRTRRRLRGARRSGIKPIVRSVRRLPKAAWWAAVITLALPSLARAASAPHGVDLEPVLAALVLVLIGAKLGGSLFERFGQSAVLGELLAGIVIGNLGLVGIHGLDNLRELPSLDLLAQIGVLFLLFEVGLETDVAKMRAVGLSAFVVAALGVIAPMVLGYFVSRQFFPSHHVMTHVFVGATLCATSVGITARVLADLKRTTSAEGSIILGAAVIDDVLGLIVLAVVAGIIQAADQGQAFQASSIVVIVVKAVAFLGGALWLGRWLAKHAFQLALGLRGKGVLLALALAFCFGFAFLAGAAGLAPIVGAFAAGLILDETHYRALRSRDPHARDLHEQLEPLGAFLVPVFFVLMGMRVDLATFGHVEVLGFALVLTIAAVLGKQVCALGVLTRGVDRFAVGLGMIPRGEVGLIFASIGATLTIGGERVIDAAVFSAVVMMVALTTLMTPPLLVWRLRKPAR
jgi:Kef-type K+ transport system membrane component KefB